MERTVGLKNSCLEMRISKSILNKDKLKADAESYRVSPMTVFRHFAAMGKNWGNG